MTKSPLALHRRLPVRRTALAQRILWHLPMSFVFSVAFVYLNYLFLMMLDAPRDPSLLAGGFLPTAWRVMPRNTTFFYWVIVAFYLALDYQSHLKDRLIRTSELERLLSDARLEALRTQLRPHFLFNALNAISAYIEINPKMARRMVEQLGDLLRLSLEHTDEQEIALDREFAFTQRYLQLQAVRFEDRLSIALDPESDAKDALVPSFILQPLVENAIKYGTSQQLTGGEVSVRAWRNNGRVCLRVSDNGPGLPAGWTFDQNAGIGLSNTRERLRRLYGDENHTFAVHSEPGGGVQVDLSLPYREA
jgi:sensor histidine kinase YesM